ncbi:MAG: hypothetical protein PUG15_04575 [Bacteroidales bacterium]|nr:hypothetical protein [Bacteroidales bacterium]
MENKLLQNIEKIRFTYLPEKIQLLLVGEAPPDASDRFFYYPNVKTNDWLFLAILKALSGEKCYQKYIKYRKTVNDVSPIKSKYLNILKENGIYLMDLSSYPAGEVLPESQISTFLKSVEDLTHEGNIDKSTPIVLIKANVYDCLYSTLNRKGYNVLNARLPFPSCGQQTNFNVKFLETLKNNKINTTIKMEIL